ncbi:MAG: methyltransferase domain-containing protein [Chloroflexi bacterium]|nr:methyltransferase domain-containing protein [Chloroflexota bacterium]
MLRSWLDYSVRRRLLDADLEGLRDKMRGSVLEIGCGRAGRRGRFQPPVDASESWTYLDIRREVEPTVVADAGCLPFRSEVFDAALCLEVLEYVPCPEGALSELWRVLKPGGTLIVSTPFLHRADTPTDSWRYTERGLRLMVKGAGFEIESVIAQGAALAVAVNVLKFAVSRVQNGLIRRPLAIAAYPLLWAFSGMDEFAAGRMPVLRSFSTGYLAVAVKE